MLSTEKPILEQKLKQILYNAAKSAGKTASYEAYMTQLGNDPDVGKYNDEAKKSIEDAADKFSKKFAEEFAKELSKDLPGEMATAIYNFVKGIGIMATVMPTVVSPMGPCSGVMSPTDFTIM